MPATGELALLLESDLGLAARNQPTGRLVLDALELALDGIRDAHALKQLVEIDTTRSGRVGDRFGRQQRALERVDRRNVGPRRAFFDRDADTGLGEVGDAV